jgi:hypothetical protein
MRSHEDDDKYGMKELKNLHIYVRIKANILPLETFKYEQKNEKWIQSYIPVLGEHNSILTVDEMRRPETPSLEVCCFFIFLIYFQTIGASVRAKVDDGKSFLSSILANLLQEVIHDEGVASAIDIDTSHNPFFCEFAATPRPSRPQSAASQLRTELISSRPNSALSSKIMSGDDIPALDYDARSNLASARSTLSVQSGEDITGERINKTQTKEMLKKPEVQQLIEWILEESSFNIVTEALHDQTIT